MFAAGAYTEDLEAAFHAILLKLIGAAAAILFASLLVAWVINRDIVGSLGRINAAMGRLSHGDLEAAVSGTDRRDEVGSMANALLVLKQELTKRRSRGRNRKSSAPVPRQSGSKPWWPWRKRLSRRCVTR